jgi:hypothetical protein
MEQKRTLEGGMPANISPLMSRIRDDSAGLVDSSGVPLLS